MNLMMRIDEKRHIVRNCIKGESEIITVYEMGGLRCVNKCDSRVNRNITNADAHINSSTSKLLPHSMDSICDLKEPGGGNIPLIWCLVLIGTHSSNTS